MTSSHRIPLAAIVLTLLAGCAAAAAPSSSSATPAGDLDCSFRSATTCWTLAPRVPETRAKPKGSPDQLLAPPRPVLASRADTLSSP